MLLSGVHLLQSAHATARGASEAQLLLLCAADLVDKTVPSARLRGQLAQAGANQVAFLIQHRDQIALIPAGLWRKARVPSSGYPREHYSGLRALHRVLRRDLGDRERTLTALESWLAAVWVEDPELAGEARGLAHAIGKP